MEQYEGFNMEAERAILGIGFYQAETVREVPLPKEAFSPGRHANIWGLMKELDEEMKPIELVTLMEQADKNDISLDRLGGIGYLSEIAAGGFTISSLKAYTEIVLDHFKQRQKMNVARQMLEGLSTDEAIELLVNIQDLGEMDDDDGNIKQAIINVYDRLEAGISGKLTGIPTRFRDLDKITGGYQKGDSIIVAARPSVGKTAFALNVAENVAINDNEDVLVFSLEMPTEQLVTRMMTAHGNIDSHVMRNPQEMKNSDWTSLTHAMAFLSNASIRVFDTPAATINKIWAKARKHKRKNKGRPMLIIIDYLQLIQPVKPSGNREQDVSEISRKIKLMARDLDCPVITLSQLSRKVEERQDKRPMLSDLRESGSLEQDADLVQFLYREDYYDKETEDQNMIEIITAKQRNGPTGTCKLAFVKEYNKFVTIDWSRTELQEA